MAQMTKSAAEIALQHIKNEQFPPLTLWELQQLIHGWIAYHDVSAESRHLAAEVATLDDLNAEAMSECSRLYADNERLRGLLREALLHVPDCITISLDTENYTLRAEKTPNLHQRIAAEVGKDKP